MSQKQSSGCLGVLALLFLIFVFGGAAFNSCDKKTARAEIVPAKKNIPSPVPPEPAVAKTEIQKTNESQDDMQDAYLKCTKDIRTHLKDPADAKFSSLGWDSEAKIAPYGYHQWLCSGWVDSLNSFGGKVREKWGAVIFSSATTWHVDYIEIGDSQGGHLPARIAFPQTPEQIAAAKELVDANQVIAQQKIATAKNKALQLNEDAAAAGDAYGLMRMGERFRDGEGVEKDLVKAREYLTKAVAAGSAGAVNDLANLPK